MTRPFLFTTLVFVQITFIDILTIDTECTISKFEVRIINGDITATTKLAVAEFPVGTYIN